MIINESRFFSWHIIAPCGKLIVKNLTIVRGRFETAEQAQQPLIAIDLSAVTQLDSSAITMLINFQKRIIRKNGHLVLFAPCSDIAELFSIVGIDKSFSICETRDDFEARYASGFA
jgi:anti-anti-sigma factor